MRYATSASCPDSVGTSTRCTSSPISRHANPFSLLHMLATIPRAAPPASNPNNVSGTDCFLYCFRVRDRREKRHVRGERVRAVRTRHDAGAGELFPRKRGEGPGVRERQGKVTPVFL